MIVIRRYELLSNVSGDPPKPNKPEKVRWVLDPELPMIAPVQVASSKDRPVTHSLPAIVVGSVVQPVPQFTLTV